MPKSAPKSISIKDAIEGKSIANSSPPSHKSANDDEEEQDDILELDNEPNSFTQDDLEKNIQIFIRTQLSDKPRFASILENYTPTLGTNFEVQFELESQLQVDSLEEIKSDLVHFLRDKLENRQVLINMSIQRQENSKNKLYTDEDKLKFLSEINPSIIRLKQQLNLDFE